MRNIEENETGDRRTPPRAQRIIHNNKLIKLI